MSAVAGSLAGQTVLVTGALGGLGQAISESIAQAGGNLVLHHLRQPAEAAEFAERLSPHGVQITLAEADVTDWAEVAHMAACADAATGGVDVLINNAGYMTAAKFVEMTLEQWQRTIDVDLTGVFLCSRHVAPSMLRRGRGAIINVSSQLAFKGAHDYASYCAAKAGVVGLTRAMARELGPVIRVNAVAPGPVETALIAPYDTPEWRDERTRGLVIQRLAQPSEIGPAVAFLASDAASLMHGQTLHINGGGVMA